MAETGNIYFASDFHLGLPTGTPTLEREKKVVRWLNSIAPDAKEIYLLGDIFDFWWEYKLVVPRGFTRFLGTAAEITDSGIPIHFFTGNHDMWVKDYLSEECGFIIHKNPVTTIFNGKKFHLAHGEGLGTKDTGYKILLSIFRNKPLQAMYSAIHPSIGVGIGHKWSLSSRLGKGIVKEFTGEDKEDLIRYSRSVLEKEKIDYFIFGHRHLARTFELNGLPEIVFLGDWIKNGSFAKWDGEKLTFRVLD
ncbi:MAG TPA: UDP-2,3-diacylglucosamine diphosphatase [Bacteroidales bacterium]|nr:UDP-2,3-diacylglucosamine diphosphatase [Bacteroidales bacterium]HPT21725.1 UDP-2,3-diacylglucosamine diphosphatase [Bacteroidales bacterium]